MTSLDAIENGTWPHWVVVRREPPGQFTAQLVGLPELRAAAPTREEALYQVRAQIEAWVASGQLVPVEPSRENPLLHFHGHLNPNDPLEAAFRDELERRRREDLESTLQEDDPECPNSSSIPTT